MEYPSGYNQMMLLNRHSDVLQPYGPFGSHDASSYHTHGYGCVSTCQCASCQPLRQAKWIHNRSSQVRSAASSAKLIPWTNQSTSEYDRLQNSTTFGVESTWCNPLYGENYSGCLTHQEDRVSSAISETTYASYDGQLYSQTVPSLRHHDAQALNSTHSPLDRLKLTIDGSCCSGSDGIPSPYTPSSPSNNPSCSCAWDSCTRTCITAVQPQATADAHVQEENIPTTTLPAHLQSSKVGLTTPPYRSHLSKRQPRKDRLCFTLNQIQQLEASFLKKKYLNLNERQQLAYELGISQLQVKTWYQNRRTKWKRNEKMTQSSN